MRSATKIAAVALLLVSLAGCSRRNHKVAPPATADAPSLPPARMASQIPPMPPPLPDATDRPVKLDTAPPPETASNKTESHPHRTVKHHPKPATQETSQQDAARPAATPPSQSSAAPPPADAQVAAAQQPSEMSPIGQLSTANDTANTADRRSLSDFINSIETGVNAIRRPLSSEEQKTVTQIRTFITRAREALKADDLDGAHTLSTKAHLLLEELTKQ